MTEQATDNVIVSLTAEVVSAYVMKNPVSPADLPKLIRDVHQSLSTLGDGDTVAPAEPLKPAVPVRKSVTPNYIVCLEDGKKFKSLKRHLGVHYNLTPDAYRQKWGLPADYPMVAPNYAAARSAMAKTIGLGQKKAAAPGSPAVSQDS